MDRQFVAGISPLEVGDYVACVDGRVHEVTDILFVQSKRLNTASFLYELDGRNSAVTIEFITHRVVGASAIRVGEERTVCEEVR